MQQIDDFIMKYAKALSFDRNGTEIFIQKIDNGWILERFDGLKERERRYFETYGDVKDALDIE